MNKKSRGWLKAFIIGGAVASVAGGMLRKKETRDRMSGIFGNVWSYAKHWVSKKFKK